MSLDRMDVSGLLDALGSRTPTPGGGAACSVVAGVAAALARMVVNYSVGKKRLAEHDAAHKAALDRLIALERAALDLADEDQAAYGRLNTLWRLPADDEQRLREMPGAVAAAIDVPNRSLDASLELLEILGSLAGTTNRQLDSDLAIAAIFAQAAVDAAAWNVRVNLPALEDPEAAAQWTETLFTRGNLAAERRRTIEAACLPIE